MKEQILKILEMQEQGKLTKDQAAELLAVLADQAREKVTPTGEAGTATHDAETGATTGAPGPREAGPKTKGAGGSAAIHEFVDAAIGMGTTVGRMASVWGGEFLNMVHRDEGGNSVTLSQLQSPKGETYVFRGNVLNVSKVSDLTLQQAEMSGNIINASKVADLSVRRGKFSQCSISGSSVTQVVIEGALALEERTTATPPTPAPSAAETVSGIRALSIQASKFSRITLTQASIIDGGTIQASAIKELELRAGSSLKNVRIASSPLTRTTLHAATCDTLCLERSSVQALTLTDTTLDSVTFFSLKISETTLRNSTWKNVRLQDGLLRETLFDACDLEDCEFTNCTFCRTRMKGLQVRGVKVRNVDFTGMTIEGEEAFRKAAGA